MSTAEALEEMYGDDHQVPISPTSATTIQPQHNHSPSHSVSPIIYNDINTTNTAHSLSSSSPSTTTPSNSLMKSPTKLNNDHSFDDSMEYNHNNDENHHHKSAETDELNNDHTTTSVTAVHPPRPRIVRGRGNRMFGLLQSTLARANTDLEKDQTTIATRMNIHQRVRKEKEEEASKLRQEAHLRKKLSMLERDVQVAQRSLDHAQKQLNVTLTLLKLTLNTKSSSSSYRRSSSSRTTMTPITIMWRPGRHNQRTRRELQEQSLERNRQLKASISEWSEKLKFAQEALDTFITMEISTNPTTEGEEEPIRNNNDNDNDKVIRDGILINDNNTSSTNNNSMVIDMDPLKPSPLKRNQSISPPIHHRSISPSSSHHHDHDATMIDTDRYDDNDNDLDNHVMNEN